MNSTLGKPTSGLGSAMISLIIKSNGSASSTTKNVAVLLSGSMVFIPKQSLIPVAVIV